MTVQSPINLSVPRDNNRVPLVIAANGVTSGTKTSTTPGTGVALVGSPTPCRRVVISAYSTNANTVAVGDSTVKAENSASGTKTGKGEQLIQTSTTTIDIVDASLLFLDVAISGDGVSYNIFV